MKYLSLYDIIKNEVQTITRAKSEKNGPDKIKNGIP
jgi:hypothetical protein